jgi:hypothetical protein
MQQPNNAPMMPPSGGGGGILGSIVQGMALGTGSAIAHRAVDAVAGPRKMVVEHENSGEATGAATGAMAATGAGMAMNMSNSLQCDTEVLRFQQCMSSNMNSLDKCQFYFDMLSQCQQSRHG